MADIAADHNIRPTGGGQPEVFVVLGIATYSHGLHRLDPFSPENDEVEYSLASFPGDEAIELWAEQDVAVLLLDLLGHNQAIDRADCAERARSGTLFALRAAEIQAAADEEHRPALDVPRDAIEGYRKAQSRRSTLAYGAQRAKAPGLRRARCEITESVGGGTPASPRYGARRRTNHDLQCRGGQSRGLCAIAHHDAVGNAFANCSTYSVTPPYRGRRATPDSGLPPSARNERALDGARSLPRQSASCAWGACISIGCGWNSAYFDNTNRMTATPR